MLRTLILAIVIFTGADIVMFDGKYSASAKHVSDRVMLYFGMK